MCLLLVFGCSPSRLIIIINFSSITILSRMEALVEALKLAENIYIFYFFFWGGGLKLYDHNGGDGTNFDLLSGTHAMGN